MCSPDVAISTEEIFLFCSVLIFKVKSNLVSIITSVSVEGALEIVRHASPRFWIFLMYRWDWGWLQNTARGLRMSDTGIFLFGERDSRILCVGPNFYDDRIAVNECALRFM